MSRLVRCLAQLPMRDQGARCCTCWASSGPRAAENVVAFGPAPVQLGDAQALESRRGSYLHQGLGLVEPEAVARDAAEATELGGAGEADREEPAGREHAAQLGERAGEVGPEVDGVGGGDDVETRVLKRERLDHAHL